MVARAGTNEKVRLVKEILSEIVNEIVGIPMRKHKRSYSDPFKYLSDQKDNRSSRVTVKNVPLSPSSISRTSSQMREQMRDEVNQEGEALIRECNSFLNNPVPQNDILQSLNLNLQEGTNVLSNVIC